MKSKTSKTGSDSCENCRRIPDRTEGEAEISKFRKLLRPVKGKGRYYRGESYQLSTFRLLQCPECATYFEDGHHFWSDPESTMGLHREEEDWYLLVRLNPEVAEKRLQELG